MQEHNHTAFHAVQTHINRQIGNTNTEKQTHGNANGHTHTHTHTETHTHHHTHTHTHRHRQTHTRSWRPLERRSRFECRVSGLCSKRLTFCVYNRGQANALLCSPNTNSHTHTLPPRRARTLSQESS